MGRSPRWFVCVMKMKIEWDVWYGVFRGESDDACRRNRSDCFALFKTQNAVTATSNIPPPHHHHSIWQATADTTNVEIMRRTLTIQLDEYDATLSPAFNPCTSNADTRSATKSYNWA